MFGPIKTFLQSLSGGFGEAPARFEENDYRIAAAALFIHLIGSDGAVTREERGVLHRVMQARFDLDAAQADELIAMATQAEGEAVDLYRFTSQLNRALDDDGRRRIIEMMWELGYADGGINEFEDNLVWRVADLLHVPSRERVELRRQVAASQGKPAPDTLPE